jgi:sugar phosphate isomerase/epimerase
MRLGISSYTFNWWSAATVNALTPERLLDLATDYEVGVIQIADNMPLDNLSAARLDALALHAADAGVVIETGTRGVHPEHLRQHVGIARRLGARIIRTLVDVDEDESIAMLRESVPELERAGVVVAIENHDRFPVAAFRRIVETVGSPTVGICLDTANSLSCGEDLRTVVRELGQYVVNLHVKDFQVRRLSHLKGFKVTGTPAGRGLLDIAWVLDQMRPEVNCILELWSEPLETVEDSIALENDWARESLAYLKGVMSKIRPAAAKPPSTLSV